MSPAENEAEQLLTLAHRPSSKGKTMRLLKDDIFSIPFN